ncbi:MAG TPA: hypothetical protein VM533_15280 [Fimbriiglobus sp.]|nr:hypothetical protein [Fimbriiglobus sp.]
MRLEELSRVLRATDPAAVLVAPVVLERVIQKVTGASWAVWRVPHGRCFLVDRATMYKYVEQDELDLPPDHQLPHTVLLLERPSADRLAGPREELLARYWRLLFHVTVHRELGERLSGAGQTELRRRVERLGPAAFEEARNVLTQDGHLAPDADDRQAIVEFVAYYLELRFFNWNLIPVYFPSLPSIEQVDALLDEDLDAGAIFRRTRLPGAPDPVPKTDDQSDESHAYYYRLERAARRARASDDTVMAAIQHTRAARVAPAALTKPAHAAATRDIHNLVDRLQAAIGLPDDQAERWRKVLPSLLDKADQGTRPVEAAILYDLQRACLDSEQTTYTLDLLEWVLSAGHKPIRRPLESQKFVRVPTHLRSATRRLAAARLNDADRQALFGLLKDALNKTEERLRERFRPTLTDALHDAGLRPTSLPEQAALAKTVEELLDRISATGFLTFADLRDAIARGHVKLPDLGSPDEYLRGDLLLRLDRRLATLLDGVYRRSEFYTRWLERLTSWTFGTDSGRWLTRNVLLPFGGAFLAAQFVWLLVYEQRNVADKPTPPPDFATPPVANWADIADPFGAVAGIQSAAPEVEANFTRPSRFPELLDVASRTGTDLSFFGGWNEQLWFHLAWMVLGVVLLALIRSASFRAVALSTWRAAYRAGRFILWEGPIRVWNHPTVRTLLTSWPSLLVVDYLLKPAALAALVFTAFPELWRFGPLVRVVTFLAAALLINSRPGRAVETLLIQAASSLVRLIRSGLIPGLIRWVAELFREFTNALEWVLARGEDWLRLRGRAGPLAVAVRAAAGLVWFPIAFLLRFYLVVLIEPMVNPLKLPLSLLFAKFVYPILALLGLFTLQPPTSPLVDDLSPFLSWPVAWLFVIGTFYLLPDAVTFLFWEMRENWRLYRANRPVTLKPAAVGPHGETVGGLLHLGFHSGTVPRLYGKLRTSERQAARTDEWRFARTHRQALQGVEEAVSRFVTREFAELVNLSPLWGPRRLSVGRALLGTNRIRVELMLDGSAASVLEWEDRSGWLVAGWADPGWLAALPPEPARVLENALAYLYKRAGVDFAREHVRAELPKAAEHFDFVPAGLLVWYGPRESAPVLYDFSRRAEELRPRTPDNLHPAAGPTLEAQRLMFGRVKLTWPEWLAVWPRDPKDDRLPPRFGPADFELVLLPPGSGTAE